MVIYLHQKVSKHTDLFKKGMIRYGLNLSTGESYTFENGQLKTFFT